MSDTGPHDASDRLRPQRLPRCRCTVTPRRHHRGHRAKSARRRARRSAAWCTPTTN